VEHAGNCDLFLSRRAFSDLGMKDNDILAYSAAATPKLEAITTHSSLNVTLIHERDEGMTEC
jgi:hypothetical protein